MSLDLSWILSLQQSATIHFLSNDLGVLWEVEREIEGDKISLSFLNPTAQKVGPYEHLVSFKIRLVCTISSEGLYDLSEISSKASSLLLEPINSDDICATPINDKVEIDLFDFKHGYKQSLMEQTYSARLRG